jgi:hypothetical protein
MAQKSKVLPYIIFGVPIAIGLYFVYKAIRNAIAKGKDAPDNFNPQQNGQVETNPKGGVSPKVATLFPLRKGSKGGKVIELQKAILQYDSTLLGKYGADGDFGTITENALKSILGKTSADSQDDIDAIIKKADDKKQNAETQAKVNASNQARISLANKLLDALSQDKRLDFRALWNTSVSVADITSDGREVNSKTSVYSKGDKIETSGYTKEFVSPNGFIKLYVGKKVYGFSPYGVELY